MASELARMRASRDNHKGKSTRKSAIIKATTKRAARWEKKVKKERKIHRAENRAKDKTISALEDERAAAEKEKAVLKARVRELEEVKKKGTNSNG
jgi:hypothetical protein